MWRVTRTPTQITQTKHVRQTVCHQEAEAEEEEKEEDRKHLNPPWGVKHTDIVLVPEKKAINISRQQAGPEVSQRGRRAVR